VADPLRYDLGVHARSEGERGGCVPDTVEAERRQIRCRDSALERLGDPVRVQWPAVLPGEDQRARRVALAERKLFLDLQVAPCPQHSDRSRVQLEFWKSPDGKRVISLNDAIAGLDSGEIQPRKVCWPGVHPDAVVGFKAPSEEEIDRMFRPPPPSEPPPVPGWAEPWAELVADKLVEKFKPLIRREVRAALRAQAQRQAPESAP
jgi:hypothetical protein